MNNEDVEDLLKTLSATGTVRMDEAGALYSRQDSEGDEICHGVVYDLRATHALLYKYFANKIAVRGPWGRQGRAKGETSADPGRTG